MKELFSKLIESNQRNEISLISTLKIWAIILVSYWVLVGGVSGVGLAAAYLAAMLESRMLFILIHIISSLVSIACVLIVFVTLYLISIQSKVFFKLTSFVSISFPSVSQMFVFSILVLSFVLFFSSIGSAIIGLLVQNNLNLNNAYWILTHPLFLTCLVFIFQFLISCVGFIALKVVLELGLCGVFVEETPRG